MKLVDEIDETTDIEQLYNGYEFIFKHHKFYNVQKEYIVPIAKQIVWQLKNKFYGCF